MNRRIILVEWPSGGDDEGAEDLVHTAAEAVQLGLSSLHETGTVQVLGGGHPEDLLPELRWCPSCEGYRATQPATGECAECGCWTR